MKLYMLLYLNFVTILSYVALTWITCLYTAFDSFKKFVTVIHSRLSYLRLCRGTVTNRQTHECHQSIVCLGEHVLLFASQDIF